MVEALWWLVGSQGYKLSFLSSSLFTIMVLFFPFLSFHMFSHFKIFYSPYFVSSLKFCSHFFLAHIISLFFFFSFYYGSFLFIPLFIVRFLLILSPSLTFHTFLLSCFFSSIIIFYHYLFTFKLLGKGLEMFILVLHPIFNYYHAR